MTPEEQRNKLLHELQSLQTVLNKSNLMNIPTEHQTNTSDDDIIPVLKQIHNAEQNAEQDAAIPTLTQTAEQAIPTLTQSYQPDVADSIATLEDSMDSSPLSPTDKSIDQNPYLPRDIIERLAAQASALSEQIKLMENDPATPAESASNSTEEPHIHKLSDEHKQAMINELIEEMLPNLMRELRARLNRLI